MSKIPFRTGVRNKRTNNETCKQATKQTNRLIQNQANR